MTPTLTQRIFAAIPDAHTVWPEWFWPCCEVCGDECEKSRAPERNNDPVLICMNCGRDVTTPVYTFGPPSDGDSPHVIWNADLEDKRNLWAVWAVACEVARRQDRYIELWRVKNGTVLASMSKLQDPSRSTTPQHALLAAIAAALGVEE